MTLDSEMRDLERTARLNPDDGGAQLGLATALERVGRSREAVEAFLRAGASEPSDPAVARALATIPWWNGPRGEGGTRFLPVASLRVRPELACVKRLGQRADATPGHLAIGRGVVFARVSSDAGEWRLVALTLTTGRSLWSEDEAAIAAAPPLVCDDLVIDAVLRKGTKGSILAIRALDVATGKERWRSAEELPHAVEEARIEWAASTRGRFALGIKGYGRVFFEPILRVLDAATAQPLEKDNVRGLNDLALDPEQVYISTAYDPARRAVEARPLGDGKPWQGGRGERTSRVAVQGDRVVAATEKALLVLDRENGRERLNEPYLFTSNLDALVVTPRAIVASFQRVGTIALDLQTGSRLWGDEPVARMLAAAEDTLYAVSNDGTFVRALDLSNGQELWTTDLEAAGLGVVARIAAAPSRIVGLTKDGALFVLAPPI